MQNIIITGAASGLGRALALTLADHYQQQVNICIADIDQVGSAETQRLLEKKGAKGWCYTLDVRSPDQWRDLVSEVQSRWQTVDLVINNAGIATGDRIDAGQWAWWDQVIDTNLKGVALGCRSFTPMMKQQKSGYFINVASLAGLMKLPMMASYNVSKAGVIALSETIHAELKPYGIGVTALCPGFFKTNLNKTMLTSDESLPGRVEKLFSASELSAADVARAAIRAMEKQQVICNPHRVGKIGYFVKRFLPFLINYQLNKESIKLMKKEFKKEKETEKMINQKSEAI